MQSKDNKKHAHRDGQCMVCGSSLSNGVCPTCGWIEILFPKEIPSEIVDFNARREEMAKKMRQEAENSRLSLGRAQTALDAAKDKADKLQRSLNAIQKEVESKGKENENYRRKLEHADKNIAFLGNKNGVLVTDNQRLSSQCEALKKEVEKLKAELSTKRQHPVPSNGAQIYVTGRNGKYTLYDLAGVVRRGNGTLIGKSGIELYNGCIFDIGEVTFRVSVPEFNIDNLIL